MRTVNRTFSILEAFTADRRSLALHEIAKIVGLTSPTTLRIVKSLVDLGYLVRLSKNEYCLSPKVLRFSAALKSTLGIREISYDISHDLAEQTKESVAIYMVDQLERVCIYAIDSELRLQAVVREGERAELGQGASGKALLAFQDTKTTAEAIENNRRKLGVEPRALAAELDEIRARGYAVTNSEVTFGNAAVAAPIFERDGTVRFALSLACPEVRFGKSREQFTEKVLQSSRLISQRNGAVLTDFPNVS
ncbi:IclR family transcriptional regulator [Oceanicola sp. 22II-s10i]|uniref:IclR family transcriptional regulator n=1 Tax=Oceanicola sp. 22II-s10i TaxID=1317116 RepID=UPI000B5236C8|nr:IclR family transcriptional regulator [Oceanicola sp. 22II-s10i]